MKPKKTKLSSTSEIEVGFIWKPDKRNYFRLKFSGCDYQFSFKFAKKLHKWLGLYITWQESETGSKPVGDK